MDINLIFLLMLLPLMSTQQPAKASSKEDLLLPADFPDFDDNRKQDGLTAVPSTNSQIQGRVLENLLSSDFFLSKLEPLAEFIDFKLRSFKFVGSLMTRDNFYLLRRFLFYLTKVSTFISNFMPSEPEEPGMMERFLREEPEETPLEGRKARTDEIMPELNDDFKSDSNVLRRSTDGQEEISAETVESYLEKMDKWRKVLDEK